jgi:hypothetical protein
MNLLTRLRELSDSSTNSPKAFSISLVTIENRELRALLDVVEAAKDEIMFLEYPDSDEEDEKYKAIDRLRLALAKLDGEAK